MMPAVIWKRWSHLGVAIIERDAHCLRNESGDTVRQVTSMTRRSVPMAAPTQVLPYAYDALDNRISVTGPDGITTFTCNPAASPPCAYPAPAPDALDAVAHVTLGARVIDIRRIV